MSDESRRALVVDDDAGLRALVRELLRRSGFAVQEAGDGTSALAAVREWAPDLVTLDLNLPDLDGIEVCRRIRGVSTAYVLMLTARPDEIDRLVGLETGADDYLTKPFSPRELTARVAALMRRPRTPAAAAEPSGGLLRVGTLTMDVESRVVTVDGAEIDLTRTEFDLLATLLGGPNRVWDRTTLLRRVWGESWAGDGHLVEAHMGNLRRKLRDDPRTGRYVRTVRGVGYRLGPG